HPDVAVEHGGRPVQRAEQGLGVADPVHAQHDRLADLQVRHRTGVAEVYVPPVGAAGLVDGDTRGGLHGGVGGYRGADVDNVDLVGLQGLGLRRLVQGDELDLVELGRLTPPLVVVPQG